MQHLFRAAAAWAALSALSACVPSEPAASSARASSASSGAGANGGPGGAANAFRILGPQASPITFERMARYPEPGWHVPRAITFSPDGKLITFLQSEGQSDQMALWAFDRASRTSSVLVRAGDVLKEDKPLSREEELRRERQRKRIQGVTDFRWAKRAPMVVIPLGGDVFAREASGKIRRLTDTKEAEIDPKPCDTGERVAYARGSELFVSEVASGRETQLTRGAPAGVTRGQSDFNGQEEFGEPSGLWWSPRCDRVAYLEVDERQVAEQPVLGHRDARADLMLQRYPRAGAKNPIVRAGIIDAAGKKTTWVRFAKEPTAERYLGRFVWNPDGKSLWLQTLTRDQRRLELWRVDAQSGAATEVLAETSTTWIEFAPMRLLDRTPRFLWSTLVAGHRHLEVRDATSGARVASLTSGKWDVESIEGVDEERGRVLFTGTKDGPLERHLYAVKLEGGEAVRLTEERGTHDVYADDQGRDFVDVHSARDRTPRVAIKGADGKTVAELPVPLDSDLASLRVRVPELVTVKGPSGDTLHGALLKPREVAAGQRHPAVIMVYGGPGVQTVTERYSARLMWQHLADRGVAVFQLDNRGSSGRGAAFEAPIHKALGAAELADQLAGAEWLASQPFIDKDRLAIYGHSYGGYLSALAMLKTPGRFKVGIAGSPVTDWRFYDTGYTERYMDTPANNPAGYAASDLGKLAGNLRGKLFIVHALMDENVHFDNTAHLVDALVAADRNFDLLVFPGERHGYRSPAAKQYALRRVVGYLAEQL
jgi:dipeptidyl-peptidase-4